MFLFVVVAFGRQKGQKGQTDDTRRRGKIGRQKGQRDGRHIAQREEERKPDMTREERKGRRQKGGEHIDTSVVGAVGMDMALQVKQAVLVVCDVSHVA